MKNIILIFTVFILYFNCNSQNSFFKNKKLEYNSTISKYQNIDVPFNQKLESYEIQSELNLYKLENLKVNSDKINFDLRNIFLPNILNDSIHNFSKSYIYGHKKNIFGKNLYLYQEIYDNKQGYHDGLEYYKIGLLLIEYNGKIKSWVKVFKSNIDTEKALESYLFENYVIVIESYDSSYDVVIIGKKKNIKYKYVVFQIKDDGTVRLLGKLKSEKIKKVWLNKTK